MLDKCAIELAGDYCASHTESREGLLTLDVVPRDWPVYIAGPMTGHVNHNHDEFNREQRLLYQMGFQTVLNPVSFCPDGSTDRPWEYYMELCRKKLETAKALVALPGWQTSRGAKEEVMTASGRGLPCYQAWCGERFYPVGPQTEGVPLGATTMSTMSVLAEIDSIGAPVFPPEVPGLKFDDDKPRWTLLPWDAVEWVVKVLEFGAKKYAPENWRKVEPHDRYADALIRHFVAWRRGETVDKDSGLPHLAHLACNALFLCALEIGRELKKD